MRFKVTYLIAFLFLIFIHCKRTNQKEGNVVLDGFKVTNAALSTSKHFSEFLGRKDIIALSVYPSNADGIFDLEEPIGLNIEVFNPRFIANQNFNEKLGDGNSKPQFQDFFIGETGNPWTKNLNLAYILDEEEHPIDFVIDFPSDSDVLNIGKGDAGYIGVFIHPNTFSTTGELVIVIKYEEPEKEIDLKAESRIILKTDYRDDQQKEILIINYLIASNKENEALLMSKESIKKWPESYSARIQLAELYENNGQLKEALDSYREGLLLFKSDNPDRITEFPRSIWKKIKALEAQLE